jgi:uncharacterized protein DUF1353
VRFFVGQVVAEQEPGGWWVLEAPLKYKDTGRKPPITVNVPSGFITDFASTPRIVWAFMPPTDYEYCAAAVVHDRLYETHEKTKDEADAIFYDAMVVHGTPGWKRLLMWWAVYAFGRRAYLSGPTRQAQRLKVAAERRVGLR